MSQDEFNDLMFKLGDLAYERLNGKPNAPRSIDRANKAAEAVSTKEEELAQINGAMDEEETAYNEFTVACENEKVELTELTQEFKKAVQLAEERHKAGREKIASKENDLKHAKGSLVKEEAKIKDMENRGEKAKAAQMAANLKQLRMDIMRRNRELREMREENDKIMNPEGDDGPALAVRAKARMHDLDDQLEERQKAYNDGLAELDGLAAEKEQEIQAAREYYDQAIFLLGEECYSQRINDSALVPIYLKLDKLSK